MSGSDLTECEINFNVCGCVRGTKHILNCSICSWKIKLIVRNKIGGDAIGVILHL